MKNIGSILLLVACLSCAGDEGGGQDRQNSAAATRAECAPNTGDDSLIWANSFDTLYQVNPITFGVSTIGDFGASEPLTDIAVAPNGELFGISFGALYQIDAGTGAAILLGRLSAGNALTFLDDGTLVEAGTDGSFSVVDPGVPRATRLGSYGNGQISSGDLGLGTDGVLYATVPGDTLVQVNANSGATTQIGAIGYSLVWGLAPSSTGLIGFTAGGDIIQIDTATGAGTLAASTAIAFAGATRSACP